MWRPECTWCSSQASELPSEWRVSRLHADTHTHTRPRTWSSIKTISSSFVCCSHTSSCATGEGVRGRGDDAPARRHRQSGPRDLLPFAWQACSQASQGLLLSLVSSPISRLHCTMFVYVCVWSVLVEVGHCQLRLTGGRLLLKQAPQKDGHCWLVGAQ
jgi:hypothetical protein